MNGDGDVSFKVSGRGWLSSIPGMGVGVGGLSHVKKVEGVIECVCVFV